MRLADMGTSLIVAGFAIATWWAFDGVLYGLFGMPMHTPKEFGVLGVGVWLGCYIGLGRSVDERNRT